MNKVCKSDLFLKFSRGALIVGVALVVAAPRPAPAPAIGSISFLLGAANDVTVQHLGEKTWLPAKMKMSILGGDRVQTQAESRCEIKLLDGSVVRIGEKTLFDFSQSKASRSGKSVSASVAQGKVWANVTKLKGSKDKFEVKTPTAVCAIRGTVVRMDADSTTRVAVYQGNVDVGPTDSLRSVIQQERRPGPPQQVPGPTQVPGPFQVSLEQWVRLVQGNQLEVRRDGRYAVTPINTLAERQVDWIQWNLQRDRLLGR
jgi:hypothetical protein